MARTMRQKSANGAGSAFETTLWVAEGKQRGHTGAAKSTNLALGLVFLKYISDAFDEKQRRRGVSAADPKCE